MKFIEVGLIQTVVDSGSAEYTLADKTIKKRTINNSAQFGLDWLSKTVTGDQWPWYTTPAVGTAKLTPHIFSDNNQQLPFQFSDSPGINFPYFFNGKGNGHGSNISKLQVTQAFTLNVVARTLQIDDYNPTWGNQYYYTTADKAWYRDYIEGYVN